MRVLIPLALLSLAACSASADDAVPEGPDGTRGFDLSGFDAVSLAGSDDVIVKTGAFAVSAAGSAKALDALDIRLDGTTLRVGRKRGDGMNWSWNDRGATVTVTLPTINAAVVAGSGDMTVERAQGDRFEASVAGSGDLSVAAVEARAVEASIAGSGDIRLAGRAVDTSASVAGSGGIDAGGLAAETAKVSIAGSGNVRVGASRTADVNLLGSGDVEIVGEAQCTIKKRGSGEVRCTR